MILGERPYKCSKEGCDRTFVEHSSLKKHMLTHSKSKPYSCSICGKTFTQVGSRNIHVKRRSCKLNPDYEPDEDDGGTSVSPLDGAGLSTITEKSTGEEGGSAEGQSVVIVDVDIDGRGQIVLKPSSDSNVTIDSQPSDLLNQSLLQGTLIKLII